ncbi:hypothetical protein K439DRAFT_1628406 [Ramaria rubella]|nr:hypothetical protein K439DRAFT_1628406 [Ramaria rubella]
MAALTNRYEDDDASRLPPGMKRVGYNADTERYTFQQGDDLWVGEPGSLYGGTLKWAGKAPENNGPSSDTSGDEYDESDSSYSGSSESGKITKPQKSPRQSLPRPPYHDKNEWGVPIVSISETGAPPPDRSLQRKGTKFRKAAAAASTMGGVVRRWSQKRAMPSSIQHKVPLTDQGHGNEIKQ